MTATLYLARHGLHSEMGHVLSGRSDIGLSPSGLTQAQRLGQLCGAYGVVSVQSSPRPRTCQTAQIVADAIGVDIELVDALDEIDFGHWTGQSFGALEADPDWRRWNEAREVAVPPDGESMPAATARAARHLDGLARAGRSHVLCVSHCDIIRGVVAHYLGLSLDRLLRFDVDPGSLTTLSVGEWGGRLVRLNEVPA
jgi:broad specificity phosphatase PhoE